MTALPPNALEVLARHERYETDWRFAAENLYRVQDVQSSKMVPMRFNFAQVRLHAEIEWFRKHNRPVRLWILKSRRAGLSTGCVAFMYHRISTATDTKALIVANQDVPARNILNISRLMWKNCPPDFRPPLPAFLKNEPPKKYMEFPTRNTEIRIASAKSVDQYVSFGFKLVHASEVSRYTSGDALFSSLYATLGFDPASAFFGESTALGQGNFFHIQCLEAKEHQGRGGGEYGGFRLLFIARHEMSESFRLPFDDDAERRRLVASLTQGERDMMKQYPSIGPEQIKWERAMRAGAPYNKNPDQWEQDYPNSFEEAFLATGITVFGKNTIKRLSQRKRPPEFEGDIYWGEPDHGKLGQKKHAHEDVRRPVILSPGDARARGFTSNVNEGYRDNLKIFRSPRKGERLFIGGDVGRGDVSTKNGDFSTLVVIAMNENGGRDEVIATWQGHCNPMHFAELSSALAWWLRYQVGDTVISPLLTLEFNGPGTTANYAIDHQNLYDNTFRYFDPSRRGSAPTNHIGWESNGKTKPLMVDITVRHMQRDLMDVPDEDVILEMSIYRKLDDLGDAQSYGGVGGHDDFVTALEIATVTMRRQDLNFGSSRVRSASPEDGDIVQYGREALSAFDPFDGGDSPIVATRDSRIITALGAADVENLVADGDWRNYDSEHPTGSSEGWSGSDGWDPW